LPSDAIGHPRNCGEPGPSGSASGRSWWCCCCSPASRPPSRGRWCAGAVPPALRAVPHLQEPPGGRKWRGGGASRWWG